MSKNPEIFLSGDESDDSSSSSSESSSSSSSREASPARPPPPPPTPASAPESAPTVAGKHTKKRKPKESEKQPPKKRSKAEKVSENTTSSEKSSKRKGKGKKTEEKQQQAVAASSGTSSEPPKSRRMTAKDLIGVDSDIDEDQQGKKDDLISYFSRRVACGISKQNNPELEGSHFIDLKLYQCREIETVSPMNRWRHAVVTLKMKSDDNSDGWKYLIKFIQDAKTKFKNCPVSYVNSPNQM